MPFDERGNSDIQLEDISLVLLRDYLVKVGSKLADEVITTPFATILDQMELYTGPKENRLLRNVLLGLRNIIKLIWRFLQRKAQESFCLIKRSQVAIG